mgnify:CR=1 FL=1
MAEASEEGRIIQINIEEEMKTAYIDYSMSVIVSRALPDVRDGLKPVHRRILYDMSNELNLYSDKPHREIQETQCVPDPQPSQSYWWHDAKMPGVPDLFPYPRHYL